VEVSYARSGGGTGKKIFGGGGMSIAFFDIDGTLLAKPSLERRFFRELRWLGKIPVRNYLTWLVEMARLAPRGIRAAAHGDKMYLRGVPTDILWPTGENRIMAWLPEFFPAAMQRAWWHALRGDSIVLVSGTPEPLAAIVKFALERELLWRGVESKVLVLATQLEVCDGRWSGRICGLAMFGEAKERAVKDFATAQKIPLSQCSGYGDSSLDRWMLAAVGHPYAVNATRGLRRIARLRGWSMLEWGHSMTRTAGGQRPLRNGLKDRGIVPR
jgi:HAD superfamily hydrolase (TIGR01490 family)